ncbi:4Fe-4S ferredoxin [Spirochaetia bacterium]|nr:4Fe-4S ferredoxin [Spirochaetia bacterium]GHV19721.1 4Fe-4S ferredoxin [Spirochaetia bacterium]
MKKKLAVKDASMCAVCLTCENACAAAFYKGEPYYEENLSCIHITLKDGKPKIVTCAQCGSCAKVCEEKAITQNDKGIYIIDKKKCKNCGKCIEECPFHVMVKSKNRDTPSKCISCGICAKQCPQDVLFIKEAS